MARIAGIDLQDNWKVDFALTKIRGLGWPLSKRVMKDAGIDTKKRVSELTTEEVSKIGVELEKYQIEGDGKGSTRQYSTPSGNRILPRWQACKELAGSGTTNQDKCQNKARKEKDSGGI